MNNHERRPADEPAHASITIEDLTDALTNPDALTGEEYRIFAAQFRSTTLGTLPQTIAVDHLHILNILLALTFNALCDAKALRDAGEGRAAVIHALRATWMFLAAFGPILGANLYAPLGDILDAVRALDGGLVVPLLTPAKKPSGGRADDTVYRRGFTDLVVLVVNMLVWHGFSAMEARKLVAQRLRRLGVQPSRGSKSITEKTVKYWCARARADKGDNLIATLAMNAATRDALAPRNELSPAERDRFRRRVLDEMLPFFAQAWAPPKKAT